MPINIFSCMGVLLAAMMTISCVQQDTASASGAEGAKDYITASIASDARPAGDVSDDDTRKPYDVLTFAGVEPGMTVFEMEAGSGYYTELFSRIVGDEGKVYMHNPASFDTFLNDDVIVRLADNRLPNVIHTKTNFDMLVAEDASVDLVTWILGPHELFFTPNDGSSLGDVEKTYAEIVRILKPGGRFVVLDHVAALGAPLETGHTLHRIDPTIVQALAEAAGLELIDESDVLKSSDDDHSLHVFDAAVRRQTDRFLMKYRKLPSQ